MKAFLVWNDGTREMILFEGAQRVHKPVEHPDGRWTETVFDARGGEDESDPVLYVETETKDITELMHQARARIEERRWQVIRKGLGWDT